ncbi:hypothetical protein CWI84_02955 [Idiomarina tyrosinivorans]|uniref:DUF2384 domain-containing protein n=1 Tax=Idiomarina tyrosinivorans TaxID=1445662 RepID=A0A432ZT21_9GAMM|nr:hypothetical protein [Idiomarina tyrosinivorans]RUO81085.1 hypothetical protein CWI84_02955 [Idiomarina tyrosinivorans]
MNNTNIISDYMNDTEFTPKKTEGALNVALNILDKWSLSDDEKHKILGLTQSSTAINVSDIASSASTELQFRLSIIIGLKGDLRAATSSNELMSNWLKRPLSNGETPLEVLSSDDYDKMLSLRARAKSLAW